MNEFRQLFTYWVLEEAVKWIVVALWVGVLGLLDEAVGWRVVWFGQSGRHEVHDLALEHYLWGSQVQVVI